MWHTPTKKKVECPPRPDSMQWTLHFSHIHTHTKYSSSWSVCCIIFLLQYITYKHVFPEVLFETTLSTLSWNELPKGHIFLLLSSSVARAFQGGRLANHPPGRPKWGRNLRKFEGKWEKLQENEERMRINVLILPTREWEAGYGLASFLKLIDLMNEYRLKVS